MKKAKDNIIIGIDTSCYTTSIAAISLDKEILFNIVAKTANTSIVVKSVNTLNTDGKYVFEVKVSVYSVEDLNKFMVDLKSISNVTNVERVIK